MRIHHVKVGTDEIAKLLQSVAIKSHSEETKAKLDEEPKDYASPQDIERQYKRLHQLSNQLSVPQHRHQVDHNQE
mgnify:CR=1 FL=1